MRLGKSGLQAIACALCISLMPSSFAAPPPSTSAAATQAHRHTTPSAFRLPDIARPKKYTLSFEPDLARHTFKGTETITLQLNKPSNAIVLNAVELKIDSAKISGADLKQPIEGVGTLAQNKEQLTINFPTTLKPGVYKLALKFTGILNDKLRGFYSSVYTDEHGKKVPIATTQMEPTDARRMFPSFDEPAYKASYQITAIIDKNHKAISNAALASEKPTKDGLKKIVSFAETPPMSTYLVALIIGDFESTPVRTVDGVPIRVWSVPGKQKMGDYALDVAARLITYYNNYFGIKYPAQKLDLIAIPDFEAGAMENLGAITFRETALLVDDKTASTETKQRVSEIVAHEIAHMWFGDLVTMKWWDDLWLNEAFATWMATKAIDVLFPQWHEWDQFGLSRAAALSSDSLRSTRAIHFEVRDPLQANEMFDEITYSKGASVLRMLEKFVGETTFQKGVHNYLASHSFGNATTEELWQAVGAASGKPVPQIMHGWVYQPGYPLISTEYNVDAKKLTLEQGRFYLDPPKDSQKKNLWQVPIGIRELGVTTPSVKLLEKPEDNFELGRAASLIANAGGDGFYRVKYSPETLKSLQPYIQEKMSVPERLGLLSDQFALTIAGKVPITDYLQLTSSYKNEQDASVMSAMIGEFGMIKKVMDPSLQPTFAAFVRDRLLPSKKRLGWQAAKDDSDLVRMLRSDVLEMLGTTGQDSDTIKEARVEFDKYLKAQDSLDPNLVHAVIKIVAYNGDKKEYDEIKHLWQTAKTPESEHRALMALAAFRKPELIKQTLAMTLTKDVRTQDAPHLVSIELSNDAGKQIAWQFTKDNWDKLKARFPMNALPHMVSAAGSISTAEHEADLRAFFKTHPVPAGKRTVAKLLERVSINVNFRKNSEAALKDWLSSTKLSSAE
jgi:puromycin-sensitive aminopeptidase